MEIYTLMPTSIRRTIPVNGQCLKEDRIASGFSQEALLASCDRVFHIGTLRRAEHGENISEAFLISLANALGKPVERYMKTPDPVASAAPEFDVSGEWTSYFVQDHANCPPYIVSEKTIFQQNGATLLGYSESEYRGKIIREVFTDVAIRGDMLIGCSFVHGWGTLTGASNIQAVISRGNDWIDGYATWYDSDTRDIRCSRYILIRNKATYAEAFIIEALALMEQERLRFAARH